MYFTKDLIMFLCNYFKMINLIDICIIIIRNFKYKFEKKKLYYI